jgi:hypothetical protein
VPRHQPTEEEKAAKQAARQEAAARQRELRMHAEKAAEQAKRAARFNKRSTPNSVQRSLSNKALTLDEYKVAEARGLVQPGSGRRTPDPWEMSYAGRITDGGQWTWREYEHGTHRIGPKHGVSLPRSNGEGPTPDENYPEANSVPEKSSYADAGWIYIPADDDDEWGGGYWVSPWGDGEESPYHSSQIADIAPEPTYDDDRWDEYDELEARLPDEDIDDRPDWERIDDP